MTTVPATPTSASSSFDFRPFGRMFWKEYRQQRTLWTAVLVFGVSMQLIVRIAISLSPISEINAGTFAPQAITALYIIPCYLVPFFLIASTSMLFALEREERTSDWLLNLAAPPWQTLLAKYGSAIAEAVSLLVVMWLWAAVLSVGSGFEFRPLVPTHTSLVWAAVQTLSALLLFGAGFLLWGTLGSLTSRRVVTAVPSAIVWWLVIYLVPMVTAMYLYWFRYGRISLEVERYLESYYPTFVAVCFLGTASLNIYLGLRWCRGQYLDASWLEVLNERLTAMLPWRRGRSSRVPVGSESEHSGWRTWQRLVWQERNRESLHTGLLVIVCATSVLLALYSVADGDGSITFAVIPLISALPLVMGVLGFRFDAAGQQSRFLANRGTSPMAIWLAKHVVWLPRACRIGHPSVERCCLDRGALQH
jgi:ABC-type transport system involved in multi-copper enzyme maturation permease subunit